MRKQNWQAALKGDATAWLLEEENPSVRYFTLRWLCDKPESDKTVQAARTAIAHSPPVQKILNKQRPEGYWGSDPRPHQGTSGMLNLLLWLGYQGNGAVRRALDYRLEGTLTNDGAYSVEFKSQRVFLPCHGADVLQLMLGYGYADDPRTQQLLDWLLRIQEADGVWKCISKTRPIACLWATADILRAFRDLPPGWITPTVKNAQARAVELFLNSNLYQYRKGKTSPRWFKFGFPLRWDTDILEVLELVAPFVAPDDERIQEGLALVLKKQDKHGRWRCEKHPNGGMWMEKYVALEPIGQPSKWVTLHALRMLKMLYSKN